MKKVLSKEEKAKRRANRSERRAEGMAELRRRAAMFGGTRVVKFDGHETIVPMISKERYTKKKRVEKEKTTPPLTPPIPTVQWDTTAQTMEEVAPVSVKKPVAKGKTGKIGKAFEKVKKVGAKIEAGRKFGEGLFGGITENIVEGGLMPGTWVKRKKKK